MVFMRDLLICKVNGVGRVFECELLEIGVKICGDFYIYWEYFFELFGEKIFEFFINIYLGLGWICIQFVEEYECKSVGIESIFYEMLDLE